MHWWPTLTTAPESPDRAAAATPPPSICAPVVQYDPTLWGGGYGYRPSVGAFGSPWCAASPKPQPAANPLRKTSSEPALDMLPAARAASGLLSDNLDASPKKAADRRPSVADLRQMQQNAQSSSSSGSQLPALPAAQQQEGQQSAGSSRAGTPPLPPQGPTGWLRSRRVSNTANIGLAAA